MSRSFTAALAALLLPLLTGCASSNLVHRLVVGVQVSRYVAGHGGNAKDYMVYSTTSAAMEPTLRIGTMVLVDVAAYRKHAPARGDIAIFKPPVAAAAPFIKRVVALPGDRLRIDRGALYVNGRAVRETYTRDPAHYGLRVRNYAIWLAEPGDGENALLPPQARVPRRGAWSAPDRLPDDCFFVLGDNRNDSEDSHIFGCVSRAAFEGKVVQIYR